VIQRRLFAFVAVVFAVVVLGCKKPEPPRLVPKEVSIVAISPATIDLLLKIEATNPNAVTLSAQSFTGKATLDGKWQMGTVTVSKPVSLPPNAPTMLEVPMRLPWSDATALAALATAQRPVPYLVEGTVTVGGERLNVDVPYSMSGTITREQLASAALKSLPMVPLK
jgi:LEA14-like dessication related protein